MVELRIFRQLVFLKDSVVPQFVLTELQHIADSSDTLKRTKGRRGLDVLRRLQTDDGPGNFNNR